MFSQIFICRSKPTPFGVDNSNIKFFLFLLFPNHIYHLGPCSPKDKAKLVLVNSRLFSSFESSEMVAMCEKNKRSIGWFCSIYCCFVYSCLV